MLYISRILQNGKCGVVDTDDNTETIITFRALHSSIIDNFLQIEGVEVRTNRSGSRSIQNILPYQPLETYTELQVKMKSLQGIDIRIFCGEIAAIVLDSRIVRDGTIVRLSRFAHRFAESTPVHWCDTSLTRSVTFVIDDKLGVDHLSPSVCVHGVKWDLRELPDNEFVTSMYSELLESKVIKPRHWEQFVIDTEKRTTLWRCASCLDTDQDELGTLRKLLDGHKSDLQYMSAFIGSYYKREFQNVADDGLSNIIPAYNEAFKDLSRMVEYRTYTLQDYDYLSYQFFNVFTQLSRAKKVWYSSIKRFENYLRFFIPTPEIKSLYVDLCNNVIRQSRWL